MWLGSSEEEAELHALDAMVQAMQQDVATAACDAGDAVGCGVAGIGNLPAGVPVDAGAGLRRPDQRGGGGGRRLDLPKRRTTTVSDAGCFILMFLCNVF